MVVVYKITAVYKDVSIVPLYNRFTRDKKSQQLIGLRIKMASINSPAALSRL